MRPRAPKLHKGLVVRTTVGLGLFILLALGTSAYAQGQKLIRMPTVSKSQNSQTMTLLAGHLNTNPTISGGSQLVMVDDSALLPESSGSGAFSETGISGTGLISIYIVRQGDTMASIAKMFGVSTNTIIWANSLSSSRVSVGQQLVILPISGVRHTVVKGDTLQSIAKKYKADLGDILSYNSLNSGAKLAQGQVIIVPDGELGATSTSKPSSGSSSGGGSSNSCGLKISTYERLTVNPCSYPSYAGYYNRPISGGTKTQPLHGYNAVDFGAPVGTPIMAAAEGTVIISKNGGYNGGYGTYVVVSHENGTQTLYGHMSEDYVSVGQHVTQGEIIGALGNTGKSTGPHVHFEVRGARNPF